MNTSYIDSFHIKRELEANKEIAYEQSIATLLQKLDRIQLTSAQNITLGILFAIALICIQY